ncbi:MBL fold metallo-hydrolase [Halocalculus aciditolerans]|uniref:MBL fold metallo-hydrolase n=1 Tax=Halocalculus aciditolerans TaxID=1383812 RepID=A0A830F9U1_9EURY|nr:MBL fold metallo-hydrolase [Halocalculus aciditolerans]GGL53334.1 MBL fold metallo-hydrolase [Halocalculus aciditolerans]
MQVTFLGTGSAMPTPGRAQSGVLVETAESRVLVDCGSGVLERLAATDGGYEDLDAVLLTHFHLDHTSDLLALLKARWLAGAGDLPVVGPPGTVDFADDVFTGYDYLRENASVTPRDAVGEFSIAGLDVETYETDHSMRCHAYRLDDAFTYGGDSEADDGLAAFAEGTAFLVDCSFPDDVDVSNHPTPAQLGRALAGRDFDRVFLTHLYPHTEGRHDEMRASIEAHYDGDVSFAEDGQTIKVE